MAEERCPTDNTDKLDKTVKQMKDQFAQMNKSMKKMVVPPAKEDTDSMARVVRQTNQQFTEMKAGIDKLKSATKDQTKETKKQSKQQKEDSHESRRRDRSPVAGPKVELGKETRRDILNALKNIRSQITVTQKKESTMSDVAAEHLAGGGGLIGATGAALGFKAKKISGSLKRKFDPLNIVNRLTGGSKLATVLAGRLMGRSEKSIRGAAGLNAGMAPGLETQTQFGTATPYTEPHNGPSAVASEKTTTLLEQMTSTLSIIATRLSDLSGHLEKIESFEKENLDITKLQSQHIQEMNDASKDAAALGASKTARAHAPVQMGMKQKQEPTKEEGGWLSSIVKFLAPVLLPLAAAAAPVIAALAALGAGAYLIYKQFDKFKTSFSLLGDSVQELYHTLVDTVGSIKNWFADSLLSVSDTIVDAGESMIEGVKSFIPGYKSATEAEKHEELKKTASGGGFGAARAQRKLAKEMAPEEDSDTVLKNLAPKFAGRLKGISNEELNEAQENLRKGAYVDPAVKSLMGEESPKGSPSKMTATATLTQMVAQAYGQLYKDKKGNPLRPSKDSQSSTRLSALTKRASTYLSDAVSPPTTITPAVSEVTSAAPSSLPAVFGMPISGQALTQAADNRQELELSGKSTATAGPSIINNSVKNISATNNNVNQGMAPARKEESSFLRSQDRGFAPA